MVHYFSFELVFNTVWNVCAMLNNVVIARIFVSGEFKSFTLLSLLETIFGISVMKMLADMFINKDKGVSVGL